MRGYPRVPSPLCVKPYTLMFLLHAFSDNFNFQTSWHLLNIRIPRLREYTLKYIRKGSRLLVHGRLEYTQSTREDGSIKDHTIVVVGE